MNRAQRRAAGKNGQTPSQPMPEPPAMPQVVEQRIYPNFGYGVEELEGGERTLHIFIPGARQLSFPFTKDAAKAVSERMNPGAVIIADNADMSREAAAAAKQHGSTPLVKP